MTAPREYDVLVVGGGPAGLSAALVLGRCKRRVVVFDAGGYRNDASRAIHGLLARDGTPPAELRRVGRSEVVRYGAEVRDATVADVAPVPGGFEATLADGTREHGRFLLLATGIADRWPRLEGVEPLAGTSLFHCPICDGYEVSGAPLAALAAGASGVEYALGLTTWSRDVVLFTNGRGLEDPHRRHLARFGVGVRTERIARLEGEGGRLTHVVLAGGERVPRGALFFHLGYEQRSDLALRLGCRTKRGGTIRVDREGQSTVPGVFVAGDATGDVLLVAVAIAEGTKCAFAINKALREAERP